MLIRRPDITDSDIRTLRDEVVVAGDTLMVALCHLALGDRSDWYCSHDSVDFGGMVGRVQCFRVYTHLDDDLVPGWGVGTPTTARQAWADAERLAQAECARAIAAGAADDAATAAEDGRARRLKSGRLA